MFELVDKARLLADVAERLRAQLAEVTRAQKVTQAGATHEDNKAEGDKDMRSTEASYIARGQAARVEQLYEEVQQVESVSPRVFGTDAPLAWGALVSLQTGGTITHHILLPAGAGLRLEVAAAEVRIPITVISTRSPLGQGLVGAHLGELVSLERDDLTREWEIVALG